MKNLRAFAAYLALSLPIAWVAMFGVETLLGFERKWALTHSALVAVLIGAVLAFSEWHLDKKERKAKENRP